MRTRMLLCVALFISGCASEAAHPATMPDEGISVVNVNQALLVGTQAEYERTTQAKQDCDAMLTSEFQRDNAGAEPEKKSPVWIYEMNSCIDSLMHK